MGLGLGLGLVVRAWAATSSATTRSMSAISHSTSAAGRRTRFSIDMASAAAKARGCARTALAGCSRVAGGAAGAAVRSGCVVVAGGAHTVRVLTCSRASTPSTRMRSASTPAQWPSRRGRRSRCAQRELPSITTARCSGSRCGGAGGCCTHLHAGVRAFTRAGGGSGPTRWRAALRRSQAAIARARWHG